MSFTFTSEAQSSDGTVRIGVVDGGYVRISTDSGDTYTTRASVGVRAWKSVACSVDGRRIVAADGDWGYLHVSEDFGNTWKPSISSGRALWTSVNWNWVDEGSILTVVAITKGGYFTPKSYAPASFHKSTDGGMTWRVVSALEAWSVDGIKRVTIVNDSIYTSFDGKSWIQRFNVGYRAWTSVACSSDGRRIVAAAIGGSLYVSMDFGSNWDQIALDVESVKWGSGLTVTAVSGSGLEFISLDGGMTWSVVSVYEDDVGFGKNKLMTQMIGPYVGRYTDDDEVDVRGPLRTYRTEYIEPDSFQDYVFVYNPSEVYFDTFHVVYTRQHLKLKSGRLDTKGDVFPQDPSKRMISLTSKTYKQPKGSRDPNFLIRINVQFFFHDTPDREVELAKFQDIATKGTFMVLKNGVYVEIPPASLSSLYAHSGKIATSSEDGRMIVAAEDEGWGYLHVSDDYGRTWKQSLSGRALWTSVDWLNNGTTTVIATTKGGYFTPNSYVPPFVFQSTDGGMTWTILELEAQSSYGTNRVTVVNGYIYTYTDAGEGWVKRSNAGQRQWLSVAFVDDDGTLIAITNVATLIYSTDSGMTWTSVELESQSVDGTNRVAVVNGYIYTYTDAGESWIKRSSAGQRAWTSVTWGDELTITAENADGEIYLSSDGGITWEMASSE